MLESDLQRSLLAHEPLLWVNESWQRQAQLRMNSSISPDHIGEAEALLIRFAGVLTKLFPELTDSRGVIESPLCPAESLRRMLGLAGAHCGRWWIKADHTLPVAGSIKARGGIYEVLLFAEGLALRHGVLRASDDRLALISLAARALFASHRIAVGSTGNLGLGIGVVAAALGFKVTVHMSSDAKAWEKSRLRACGADVIEHDADYGAAVAAGRLQARSSTDTYFVDDENSMHLFVGYSVAALRLRAQLAARSVQVDEKHPLFVYLPCGVGGAPGGITYGLRHLIGDHVHCFLAEPVATPCVLIRLACAEDRPVSVCDIGLDGRTEADGLAVARASEFAVPLIKPLVSGVFTVTDDELFESLYVLAKTEGMRIEPSAAAALRGPHWILESEAGRQYLAKHELVDHMENATHIVWTTGGALLPEEEYRGFFNRGKALAEV